MIISIIIFVFITLIASIWLISYIADNYSSVIIVSGSYLSEVSAAKLVAAILIAFLLFYLFLRALHHLIKITRYASQYRLNSKLAQSRKGLYQGYLSLIEGDTNTARINFKKQLAVAENPSFHHLGLARVAQMEEAYNERDKQLKLANESQHDAHTAIAISQAEMQIHANQLEQARAGLITLLEEKPTSDHAKKLLAKVFYKQEDWKQLLSLLPKLNKISGINKQAFEHYEEKAIKGVFQMHAHKEGLERLEQEWKNIPSATRQQAPTLLKYCESLIMAGGSNQVSTLLNKQINTAWDESLVKLYGKTQHSDPNKAIQAAEGWLVEHDNCPVLLLTLARLYHSQKLWGKARRFYLNSLNKRPNKDGYLEFAELLEEIDEKENAQHCYKVGLSYCVNHKAHALILQNRVEPKLDISTNDTKAPEDFPFL